MANKVNTPDTDIIVDAKGKLEVLFEKYGKTLLWVLVVIGIAVGGYFLYKSYSDSKEQERIAKAEKIATIDLATEAEAGAVAAHANSADVKDTASANFLNYLAASRYVAEDDIENAKVYFAKVKDFSNSAFGAMLNAATYGLRGDIAVAEDDLQAAVENFKKAVAASDDEHSFITYSEKLARVYNALGDKQAAMQCYKDIVAKYPDLGVNPNEVSVDGVSNRSAAYFKRFIW